MHLFTWNLCKSDAMLRHALVHLEKLARSDMVVAAFQEWPSNVPIRGGHGLKAVPTQGKVVLLYSTDLRLLHHQLDKSERATIARFELPRGNELTCVGLHWYARNTPGLEAPEDRGGALALFRHHLDLALADSPSVIMGDFNCSPDHHEREMCSPYCLFARTPIHRQTQAMETVFGTTKKPWTLVTPEVPARGGTYFYPGEQRWSALDHFALTHHLAGTWSRARVLTALEGNDFLTPEKQVPKANRRSSSDHLPVICELHYQ
jgi:endonuclease/exonuclease/phosphatase family metal-dependent hydrolase